jgi:hypothetical protein
MKEIKFNTTKEAADFKMFLNLKAVQYANNADSTKVIIRSPMTDQQWFHLLIKFGMWL